MRAYDGAQVDALQDRRRVRQLHDEPRARLLVRLPYPCYAYLMARRFGKVKTYDEWCEPVLASSTIELLEEEIDRLTAKIRNVQLCFTTVLSCTRTTISRK